MILDASGSSSWYSDPHNLRNLIRLIAYPVAFVVAAVTGWWHRRKQKIALVWPCVEGHVHSISVAPVGDRSSLYSTTFQYSYFLEEYRSGEYSEMFDSEYDANQFAERMKDQRVPVRYNPKNPDDSLIEEADVEQYVQLAPIERMVPLR
jgi:hypothetical protein